MQKLTGRGALVRGDRRGPLDRVLDSPQLARLVPRLAPELLHRVLEHRGLEACGHLIALATPGQISRILDLDLWRSPRAGLDEQFDADRFGLWLEVLVELGPDVAASIVAAMDPDLVAAGLAQHVRVHDIAAFAGYVTTDGTEIPAVVEPDGGLACEIAGHRLVARRADAWDAVVDVLLALEAGYPDCFSRLVRGCRALCDSRPEADGLDDLLMRGDQAMFDLAIAREERREALGFVPPAPARAFLESSRRLRLDADAPPVAGRGPRPRARAADPPRGLMAPEAGTAHRDELAALANALAAGCTIAARAFTPQEASEAVLATCQLGRECWPARWPGAGSVSDDVPVQHDVVTLFQVGWTVLHDDVCMPAASRLLEVLAGLPRHDPATQAGLDALRVELTRHCRTGTPWLAREALDVLATLDLPAWTTLLALIAECPAVAATIEAGRPGGPRRVDPSAFTFIAHRAQIAAVDAFLASLPEVLRG